VPPAAGGRAGAPAAAGSIKEVRAVTDHEVREQLACLRAELRAYRDGIRAELKRSRRLRASLRRLRADLTPWREWHEDYQLALGTQ
jgi:hypothetical protein